MADRRVTGTGKDSDGDITSLCSTGAAWSPRSKQGAISDIESERHTYHVRDTHGRSDVIVVRDASVSGGKYLRTDPNGSCRDNLDELPDC